MLRLEYGSLDVWLPLEGARGIAGAVYLVFSSQPGPDGVPWRGKGKVDDCVLVLKDEAGDSATGEKYESPPL